MPLWVKILTFKVNKGFFLLLFKKIIIFAPNTATNKYTTNNNKIQEQWIEN